MNTRTTGPTTRVLAPFLLAALATACTPAGPPASDAPAPAMTLEGAAATITVAEVADRVGVLAHDSMAGRDSPSPELERAADYMVAYFRGLGLEPAGENGTYIDSFDLTTTRLDPDSTFLGVEGGDSPPTYGVDYFMVPPPRAIETTAYFAGIAGEAGPPPAEARGKILIYQNPVAEAGEEWQRRLMGTLQIAMMSGAPAIVFVLAPDFDTGSIPQIASMTAGQQAPFGLAGLSHEAGAALVAELGGDLDALIAAGEPAALDHAPIAIRAARTEVSTSLPNVVAMLQGSDPALRDSYVVLTAHFDHVGVGSPNEMGDSIYNGADDNASGTVAVMEIAGAFAALDEAPARSVVFLMVSAEEKGLVGSRAWVEDPTLDLVGVVANINLDMVGRNAPDTIIGIGQEYSTLEGVVDQIVAAHPDLGLNVILDPKPEERYFFRSDQLPFVQAGIPAVFFTTSDHEDYHKPSDEAHKVDNDKLARVARLGFYLAHAIATNPEPPEYTEEGKVRLREVLGTGSPF